MQRVNAFRVWFAFSIIAASSALGAQDFRPGFYVRADLGPAFTRSTDVKEFIGSPSPGRVKFDTGVRFGIGGGYLFCPYFALDGETGWIYNEIDSISGGIDADARVMQVPFLANAVFQYPNPTHVTPFFGGGAGGSSSVLDIDATSGSVFVHGTASDTVFAYQGFGGLKYEINDRLAVGVVYKYFKSGDPEWDVRRSSQNIKFDGTETHSVSVTVNFRF